MSHRMVTSAAVKAAAFAGNARSTAALKPR